MKKLIHSLALLGTVVLAVGLSSSASAQNYWTGSGSNLNWDDSANWANGVPDASMPVYFEDLFFTSYTNAAGAINNVVNSSIAIGSLNYTANSQGATNHFHTTLVPSGSVLTLGGLGTGPALLVGGRTSGGTTNCATITGLGGLLVNDPMSRIEVQSVVRATLDLSGLNTFTANLSNLWVGASPDNSGEIGILLLARTNLITTAANPSAPGVLLGRTAGNAGSGAIVLGQATTLNTDGLVVGGTRGSLSSPGSRLSFNLPAANPTFTLRGSAGGSSRAAVFNIGDITAEENDYLAPLGGNSSGTADFSGGIVDIRADNIYVARSAADIGAGGNFTTAAGNLIVERGTVDANRLYVSYKQGTNGSYANPSAVTLKSNAVMTVNQDVSLAFRFGVTNGPVAPVATLNVNDSAVLSIGGNLAHGNGGVSTISLGGGKIDLSGGGDVYAYGLSGFGTITNAGNITVTNNFVPGGVSTAGTLDLAGNLFLQNPFPLTFDLGPSSVVGSGVNDHVFVRGNLSLNNNPLLFTYNGPLISGATYHLIDFTGSRAGLVAYTNLTRSQLGLDQTTPGHVDLVVTNWSPATLTWVGNANANGTNNVWNALDTNWNNGGSPDKYFPMDAVVFDDTASYTNIYPSGALYPASITINASRNFMLTNRSSAGPPWVGSINGYCSVTKNGTGTFTLGCYSNNFTGNININDGIFRIFDPTFTTPGNNNVLGSTNSGSVVYVNNGGTFDFSGVGSVSGGKNFVISGNGFNNLGAFTNGVSNAGATLNGFLVTLGGNTTVAAEVGGWGLKGATTAFYSGLLNLNGFTLTKLGAARFALQDVVATNAGSINFGAGTFQLQNTILDGPGTLTLSNGTLLQFAFLTGATSTVAKAVSTVGNVGLLAPAAGSAATPVLIKGPITLGGTLAVTNNQPVWVDGVVSGNFGISKYGNSNLVLNSACLFTGPTLVNAGTLALGSAGSIAFSPLIQINPGSALDVSAQAGAFTVASGQTLNLNGAAVGDVTVGSGSTLLGSGLINGSLTVATGGEVAPATTNVTGTITISSNLALAGGHLTWEMAPSFDISDAFVVGGNLTLSGVTTFTVNSIGGFDPSGTNTIITYSGTLTGGLPNLALNSSARFVVEFVDPALTPGKIQVRLVNPSPSLVWTGTNPAHPTWWDIKTTTNWNNGGTPDVFWSADSVTFDDTASTYVVDLIGTLGPASIQMANPTQPYVFRGSGLVVTSSLTNDGAGLVFSNTANNFFTGAGLVLNSGTVTFAQPTNASLAANLVGVGTFTKTGSSNLTLIGNSANFFGAVNVAGGSLRAGSSNVLGSGATTIASGATLDINGQVLTAATSVAVVGVGADGLGAINNRGAGQTNSLAGVVLSGNTTVGALSNAWGIVNGLTGAGYTLTKTNANDVWIMTGTETDLGALVVNQGRLVFSTAGTTLGRPASNVVVFPNATLALATTNRMPNSGFPPSPFDAGAKPITLLGNAAIESIGFPVNQTSSNSFSGSISITNNGIFRVGGNSWLQLFGPISGTNGQLVLTNGGTLLLAGTNSYTSNTLVYSGTLVLADALALPTNNTVILSNNITTGNPSLQFVNSPVFPTNNSLRISTANAAVSVGGDGTWLGPLQLSGANTFNLFGGPAGLNLLGTINNSNATGSVSIEGYSTRIAGAFRFTNVLNMGVSSGLSAAFNDRFTTAQFDGATFWTSMVLARGRVNCGTNNALPPSAPIRVGTLSAGVSDRRIIFNLGGFNQTFTSLTETAVGDSLVLIGNSSTNSNSTLTYAGLVGATNTWAALLVDDLDSQLDYTNNLGLTVTSGLLVLLGTNTYTGPTLISGGTLLLNLGSGLTAGRMGQLGTSPITVNGAGTLGGNGLVGGPVTIGAGGTLAPGASIGFFTINNKLTLQSGSRCVFEVNLAAGTNDQVVGISTVTLGGTLVITNLGGAYADGTVLKLFDAAAYLAGNVTIQPPAPAPGLMWDASQLAVDGTLRVAAVVPPVVSNPVRLPDGNIRLSITGVQGQGWSVRAATNVSLPLPGWTVLQSGSLPAGTFDFTDLTATNYPARYYRVSSP